LIVGDWEPVDTVAAAEMIKTRLEFVKAFVYENGWSRDWPLAADGERRKLLKEVKLLLVSFEECKILSCGVRDWLMRFVIRHLAQYEVSECRLVETPQSICFLECGELSEVIDLLKLIKCERDDGADVVSRAVDSSLGRARVKEKIEFDDQFSSMLLDKRLLRGEISSFDDEGTIGFCGEDVYYAKTHPQGDDFITWLLDFPLIDESFEFPRSIRAYNLDIWVAVLRAIHFTCRDLGAKYAKKLNILGYDACLVDAINLCVCENERRNNVPEHEWNKYAYLLHKECEERGTKEPYCSLNTHMFLCAVKDVLEEASHPTFYFPDLGDCMKLIHGNKDVSDERVWKSMDLLRSVVANKVPLADSKILLVENSRISLLNDLIRLSVFDHRSYILNLLKRCLRDKLDGIVDMDTKAKVAAAGADLLSEKSQEKEKNSGSKKRKHGNKKRTSTSLSSLHDPKVKHEHPVNLEPDGTHLSLEDDVEESAVEPECTNETAKDMQTMPGQESLSKPLESALREGPARSNLALDMTLKALCNIKVLKEYLVHNRNQFPDNMEEQVPFALGNFFAAFASNQMKEEGLYSYLLGNVLASLEEAHLMSSNASELLVAILEFWPCWKIPEIQSVVTHLFTVEEYERMSCSKCRKKPNYPEQSSYGIVMAADSIRDLKSAFGKIKFEDILKVIRMEEKMLCDIKTGGCGKANFVHHIITTRPPIFTIVLEWEKDETEKEISETTNALEWEIDLSTLYEGLQANTKYRLVSMVGCGGEDGEHICMAFKKNRWVSFRHEALAKKAVGSWKSVVKFCGETKFRPEILFYQAVLGSSGENFDV
ncbi:unnamed protein product, partial [Microthlaspi erraticum]